MIDLRSDTVTKPTPAMREAMAWAAVGDDVYGEDPTVNALQEKAAALVGKQAALFVPSGTMGNQLCIRVLTRPGQEVIVDGRSHVLGYEQGAGAALAGVQFHWISSERGLVTAEQVARAIRPRDTHTIPTGLIMLENTHNTGGGTVYPIETVQAIHGVAQQHGLPMHLDGARLLNAVVATGTSAADYAQPFDTLSFCLSKGLGAPVGSIIATNHLELMPDLRRYRRMYGGAMRQAGILAAAGLYALDHHIERLQDDHTHATYLATLLREITGVSLCTDSVDTNIVMFDIVDSRYSATELVKMFKSEGLLINCIGGTRYRAVTHLDVTRRDIEEAGRIIRKILND